MIVCSGPPPAGPRCYALVTAADCLNIAVSVRRAVAIGRVVPVFVLERVGVPLLLWRSAVPAGRARCIPGRGHVVCDPSQGERQPYEFGGIAGSRWTVVGLGDTGSRVVRAATVLGRAGSAAGPPDALDTAAGGYLARLVAKRLGDLPLTEVAVGGKTLRGRCTDGTAVHLLAAVLHHDQVEAKSNEIPVLGKGTATVRSAGGRPARFSSRPALLPRSSGAPGQMPPHRPQDRKDRDHRLCRHQPHPARGQTRPAQIMEHPA